MRRTLIHHPHAPPPPGIRISAAAVREAEGVLLLDYAVTGELSEILVPPPAQRARKDDLWQHTCFEAFVRGSDEVYFEFNLSPSGEWAAYRFDDYRSGRSSPAEVPQPTMEVVREHDCLRMRARLLLDNVSELTGLPAWHVGISVILEDANSRRSFWALAHPPGEPDFHHSDCFALELAAPSGP